MVKVKKTMENEDKVPKVRHMAEICVKYRYENQKYVHKSIFFFTVIYLSFILDTPIQEDDCAKLY